MSVYVGVDKHGVVSAAVSAQFATEQDFKQMLHDGLRVRLREAATIGEFVGMGGDEIALTPQRIETVKVGEKYHIHYEQGATKGVLGFKVEVSGDDKTVVAAEARSLLLEAMKEANALATPIPTVKPQEK